MQDQAIQIIELAGDYEHGLLMRWSKKPTGEAVNTAFATIRDKLNNTMTPTHCIVDLRSNPTFPLAVTLNGAVQLQSHTSMGKWLVIGGNTTAKFIGRAIVSVVNNVEWFNSEEEAYQRLQNLLSETINKSEED